MTVQTFLPLYASLSSSPPSLPSLSLLQRCTTIGHIQQLHTLTIKTGLLLNNPLVAARFVESICSTLEFSSSSYSSFPPKPCDVDYLLSIVDQTIVGSSSFIYNTIIKAYNQIDRPQEAFLLFYKMLQEPTPVLPDKFTFSFVIKSCAQLCAIEEGEQMHCFLLKTGFASDLFVRNSLIHMYVRSRKIGSAYKVFDEMPERNVVSWNSMIDGFLKTGDIGTARRLFDEMPQRNIVSWNCMISGYSQASLPYEAIEIFIKLQASGLKPDECTLVSIISAITDLGLLSFGKRVHGSLVRNELSLGGVLGGALIDMYSKCGIINDAFKVFVGIPNKSVGHWTSMIVGFAAHGFADASLQLFSQMRSSGVRPNYVTFIGVLSACTHAGLVEEGLKHFKLMRTTYYIEPGIQHYGCLVDLLGRSGYIEDAKLIIDNMPMEPGPVIWSTLLSACRSHGNIELGEIAAQKLNELAPDNGSGFVLLADLYGASGRWKDCGGMRRMMGQRGLEKLTGLSWIELDGEAHEFVAGDKFHPRSVDVYRTLDGLECIMRRAGDSMPFKVYNVNHET